MTAQLLNRLLKDAEQLSLYEQWVLIEQLQAQLKTKQITHYNSRWIQALSDIGKSIPPVVETTLPYSYIDYLEQKHL